VAFLTSSLQYFTADAQSENILAMTITRQE
jgi:hypothetical protein